MKKFMKIIGALVVLLILVVGGYFAYAYIQYHRLPDNLAQKIENKKTDKVELAKEYKIATFNIGYGSYPPDYTFFMDGGKEVRARSKQAVEDAINEDSRLMKVANPDFINIQEIDWQGDRSWHVNQPAMMKKALPDYLTVLTQNYDSAYLFYPVTNPIGKAKSGIMTFSKYEIDKSTRYQLPIETNFNKFFDLDRAFTVNELPIAGSDKKFVLINTHLSAWIKDRKIQKQQLTKIFHTMQKYVDEGDYVICGGDYNHVLYGPTHNEKTWLRAFPTADLTKGMHVVAPKNAPSVRDNGTVYNSKDITGTIDGFLVSDNIKDSSIKTIVNGFKSSDHEPVVMKFSLNK